MEMGNDSVLFGGSRFTVKEGVVRWLSQPAVHGRQDWCPWPFFFVGLTQFAFADTI
jgi:hypothetical protein